MSEEPDPRDVALDGALDYLRNIDHTLLDGHYAEQSWYLQCRPFVEALAVVHRLAHAGVGFGAAWDDIRDTVIAPSEKVIEHYTDGPPHYRLALEEGDAGWDRRWGTRGCSCTCCVETINRMKHGRFDGWCTCLDHPQDQRCDCAHCEAFMRDEARASPSTNA